MVRRAALVLCLVSSVCSTVLPLHARAQQTEKAIRLGIICGTRCEGTGYDALKDGLARLGWVEGRNLTVDKRGADGEQGRLPALAAELVASKPDLIVAVAPQPTRTAGCRVVPLSQRPVNPRVATRSDRDD